jgi:hypothetical protein
MSADAADITVPRHAIAHGRAGDKGNRSNISLAPYVPEAYPYLVEQVTEARVLALFQHKGASGVTRYELPNLPALNFVIDDALEGGVNAALGQDMHGKTLAFLLLGGIEVRVPRACLSPGSPYLDGAPKA